MPTNTMEFSTDMEPPFRKKVFIKSIICLTLFFFNYSVLAQQVNPISLDQDSINYKKLYLHTDRDFYFVGDTVWFKAYYVHGQTNRLVDGIYTMYSELLDETGKTVNVQIWPVDNGTAIGQLVIADTLDPGNYLLRAYTEYQKGFGEEAFYHKKLKISMIEEGTRVSGVKEITSSREIDISFLPEGGMVLAGQRNRVAIKAINEDGMGISVRGNIIDAEGRVVSDFETKYRGMGVIDFFPKKGEVYKAHVEGFEGKEYEFCDVVNEGIKIEYAGTREDQLYFGVVSNSKRKDNDNYSFAIMNRGKVIFHQDFKLKDQAFPIKVEKFALPAGINRFILLDDELRPLSERLYFSKNFDVDSIQIKLDQEGYMTRSKVNCTLLDSHNEEGWSDLSVSVVNMDAIEELPSQNILSWLLVDSELNGYIESPSDYFIDDPDISSSDKLDLLVLTQGWSNYLWNSIPEIDQILTESRGITISGRAERVIGKKPLINGDVTLNLFSNDFFYTNVVETDEVGRFEFNDIYFTDSATIYLQSRNEKDKLMSEVFLDPIVNNFTEVNSAYLPRDIAEIPLDLYKQEYYNEKAMTDFLIEEGVLVLDEVTVIGHKKAEEQKRDGHFRIYMNADKVLEVTKKDYGYLDVFQYLQGRVAGLDIRGNLVTIHGPSSFGTSSFSEANEPLYLLDGNPVPRDILETIPMSWIDKIEVLKDLNAAVFGVRGANGVIAVYIKKELDDYEPQKTAIIAKKIAGYSSYRQFYNPKYAPENIHSKKPDNRITLFWEPEVLTQNGQATISFFTSDDTSRFRIFVEGITSNGQMCLGTKEFIIKKERSWMIEN